VDVTAHLAPLLGGGESGSIWVVGEGHSLSKIFVAAAPNNAAIKASNIAFLFS
jgi:hypothetical protein